MLIPAGVCLPLLVTLLSWRLALLIPANRKNDSKNARLAGGYVATGLDFSQDKETNFIAGTYKLYNHVRVASS